MGFVYDLYKLCGVFSKCLLSLAIGDIFVASTADDLA